MGHIKILRQKVGDYCPGVPKSMGIVLCVFAVMGQAEALVYIGIYTFCPTVPLFAQKLGTILNGDRKTETFV
jgi:hypothetical protein